MKKFKLTTEKKEVHGITLYQIEATEDYTNGVKKGDKGGWIEKEDNLNGDAWVSGNARVYGNAWVYGDAWVSGDAWYKSPLQIQGTKHFLNECKKGIIRIGCYELPIDGWLERYKEIGEQNGYSKQEIEEYGYYLELAKKLSKLREEK